VRMTVFLNLLRRRESAERNQAEAAELLGVSARTFRRWTRRYEERGQANLIDRRLGKVRRQKPRRLHELILCLASFKLSKSAEGVASSQARPWGKSTRRGLFAAGSVYPAARSFPDRHQRAGNLSLSPWNWLGQVRGRTSLSSTLPRQGPLRHFLRGSLPKRSRVARAGPTSDSKSARRAHRARRRC
jgi:transposase-like protein